MLNLIKKASNKSGLPPGTLIHIGERKIEKPRIRIINYDEAASQENEVKTIEECFPVKEKPGITWINIDGLHDVKIIETIGKHLDIHSLILEDILHTRQRPKFEDFENYAYIVLRMIYPDEKTGEITTEQVSLILGLNFVISFHEKEGDVFNQIRERISNGKGRIRKMGADYLAYALIDMIVDHYFISLEKLGEKTEKIEEELMTDPSPETLQTIHRLKRETILLRKSVWPLREVISNMERAESTLIHESTNIYFSDVYDHIIQIIDTIEAFREMLSSMLDIYLSSISNKTNEVMKVLTIIATIFIPLTFIAGVYGMNFKYMPELEWQWGYFSVWVVMIFVAVAMLFYIRKKDWL